MEIDSPLVQEQIEKRLKDHQSYHNQSDHQSYRRLHDHRSNNIHDDHQSHHRSLSIHSSASYIPNGGDTERAAHAQETLRPPTYSLMEELTVSTQSDVFLWQNRTVAIEYRNKHSSEDLVDNHPSFSPHVPSATGNIQDLNDSLSDNDFDFEAVLRTGSFELNLDESWEENKGHDDDNADNEREHASVHCGIVAKNEETTYNNRSLPVNLGETRKDTRKSSIEPHSMNDITHAWYNSVLWRNSAQARANNVTDDPVNRDTVHAETPLKSDKREPETPLMKEAVLHNEDLQHHNECHSRETYCSIRDDHSIVQSLPGSAAIQLHAVKPKMDVSKKQHLAPPDTEGKRRKSCSGYGSGKREDCDTQQKVHHTEQNAGEATWHLQTKVQPNEQAATAVGRPLTQSRVSTTEVYLYLDR